MRMSLRKTFRLALIGTLGLVGLCQWAAPSLAAAPAEKTLPNTTFVLIKVDNAAKFREAIHQSQMGQLFSDPAMKPLKDDIAAKLDEASKQLQGAVGVSILELLQLPQGPVSFAILAAKEGTKVPVSALFTADAGARADAMKDVMTKATKLAEGNADTKVSTETFKDLTLHVMRSAKEEDKDAPPIIWTNQGSVYHFSTDMDALKDVLSHSDGRDDSLADKESFQQISKKVAGDSQLLWYIDVAEGIKLVTRAAAAQQNGGNAQQVEALLQVTGINGLKAIGGSLAMGVGNYDVQTKLFVLAPGPVQGVLKVFPMPTIGLRPEPWVPATAASYESISWDLDGAYKAVEELANMIQPGLLQALQQQIAGPTGGEGIDFQKDIFGPLGDRITIISDFKKKPANRSDDNQRTLLAISLENSKAFRNTLNKLFAMGKISPKKRDFQGNTIYDIDPNDLGLAGAPNGQKLEGPISVCVAKETCFLATEPTLLEQVLRAGGPRLADSPEFQAVAREIPEQTSTLSYTRPEEAVRQLYDMVKGGQLQEALKQAAAAKGNAAAPNLDEVIDKNKLPEFSAISKYLSQSGGYGVMTEDGFYRVSFSLRKANP